MLPPSEPWEAWLAETGELPPDFDAMRSEPYLPDPLEGVQNAEQWPARRDTLQALFHQWVLGRVPPPPSNGRAEVLDERHEAGATIRAVQLVFGPNPQARLRLELLVPPGAGPFPVFLTQHTHRAWALIALRRGYLGCVYWGADGQDDTDSFLPAYPDCDWSRLTRRAWAASRCVDYLATVPQADSQRIALTGHSRNGKAALIASALDPRIALVVSSSSGAGGTLPARFFSEQHFGEGIELLTRAFPDWFHPRLRFFVGRENKLPVDMHELVALSAPRPCLLSIALNDNVESSWAMQQTYRSVQRVYRLLGSEKNLRILWRDGGHETGPTLIERYVDWCDMCFGRGTFPFEERLIHPVDWEAWRAQSGTTPADLPRPEQSDVPVRTRADAQRRHERIQTVVHQMLGEAPPMASSRNGSYGTEAAHVAQLLRRSDPGPGVEKTQIVFGEYINADVYMPAELRASGRKAPVVVWLHPFSFSHGYAAGYKRGEPLHRVLAQQGFVVFCFDQIGCGRRIEEVEGFYQRHPRWSLLGKMVRDAQAALDALAVLPFVEPAQLWTLGYGLGGMVGLHLGVVDDRLAGLASVCGPVPFQLDAKSWDASSVQRWSHLHLLLPQLGFITNHETPLPYDIQDLLACLAPRPTLVVSPQWDWEAPVENVTQAVEAARPLYALHEAGDRLEQLSPPDYNRFGPETQALVIAWLKQQQREA